MLDDEDHRLEYLKIQDEQHLVIEGIKRACKVVYTLRANSFFMSLYILNRLCKYIVVKLSKLLYKYISLVPKYLIFANILGRNSMCTFLSVYTEKNIGRSTKATNNVLYL